MKFSGLALFLVLFFSCQAQGYVLSDLLNGRINPNYYPKQSPSPYYPPAHNPGARQPLPPPSVWAPYHDRNPPNQNSQVIVESSRSYLQSLDQFRDILSRGTMQLTLNIDKIMEREKNPRDNIVFSPLSLQMLLANILMASKGQTFDEIVKIFNINSDLFINSEKDFHKNFGKLIEQTFYSTNQPGAPKFNYGTGLFVTDDFPIGISFKSTSEEIYKSHVTNINYRNRAAPYIINEWVKSKTNGLIPRFLDERPSYDTKAIVASALYFKGEWEKTFYVPDTPMSFYISQNETTKVVGMISREATDYRFAEDNRLQIVAIPYKNSHVSMYIVVPKQKGIEGLRKMKKELTPEFIDDLIGKMKVTKMLLILPKMDLSSTIGLGHVLAEMGITSLADGKRADLSVLTSNQVSPIDVLRTNQNDRNPGIFFETIVQKIKIAVTEAGTEAAAVTVAGGDRMLTKRMSVKQPFLFFIRNDVTKSILFYASINDPYP